MLRTWLHHTSRSINPNLLSNLSSRLAKVPMFTLWICARTIRKIRSTHNHTTQSTHNPLTTRLLLCDILEPSNASFISKGAVACCLDISFNPKWFNCRLGLKCFAVLPAQSPKTRLKPPLAQYIDACHHLPTLEHCIADSWIAWRHLETLQRFWNSADGSRQAFSLARHKHSIANFRLAYGCSAPCHMTASIHKVSRGIKPVKNQPCTKCFEVNTALTKQNHKIVSALLRSEMLSFRIFTQTKLTCLVRKKLLVLLEAHQTSKSLSADRIAIVLSFQSGQRLAV